VFNETFKFPITKVNDVAGALKITVMEEDIKNHDLIGSDTLYFPLLYNEGKGLQGNFPIFN
jgi:hypothetical protein